MHETEIVVIAGKEVPIDKNIVQFVKALNTNGLRTSISCGGHGKLDASIMTCNEDDEYRLIIIVSAEDSVKRFRDVYQKSHERFEELHKKPKFAHGGIVGDEIKYRA